MKVYKRFKFKIVLVTFSFGFLITSCAKNQKAQVFTGEALGTTYQVKFFHDTELPIEKGLDSIFEVINRSMSTYQPDSDISKINTGDTSIVIDNNFKKVFKASEKIYLESNGFFDPTVGNLVNAYGFGPESRKDSLNTRIIDSLLQYVGLNKLKLTSENRIVKDLPGIYLDFNAIAKGFTVDVIAEYLNSKKVANYLVEVGGELVAKGSNMDSEEPWVVAIDDPLQKEGEREFEATLYLKDRGMATSGNYRKFRLDSLNGQRYVHTINPITGRSEKSNLLSASVLAKNCALADGYATAFMALGLERSQEMLSKIKDVDVYFIYAEDEEVKVFSTPGFKKVLRTE
ncbi:thiamine biosynthesis lipoprotein [Gillisia mitskevichiae]|uniref:FAD:protein FMN transferase n=1 Tax=Gillisia mitskevichiae TaxID=270921 RepID=A0A495P091_9FLAO|nr:FAD:protein FMN transferase [Gillisia mitskevichiae]RKS43435.1 thiamine biosynthesis lipoprotein [Gillisia mitskevichiae]